MVQSPDQRQARRALKALIELRRKPGLCVPVLVAALDDSNSDFRSDCVSALGQFGQQAKDAVPRLERACSDPDESVRTAATNALHQIERDPVFK